MDHVSDVCSFQESIVLFNFLKALAIFESNTSKSGIIRPNIESDDVNSSKFLVE